MGHRDCALSLDETADGEKKEMPLAQRARLLAFAIARNRPRKLAPVYEKQHALRKREYRVIVQSSSERALGEIARKSGDPRLGGEEVRFIDVAASEPGSQGIFDGKIKPEVGKTFQETTKAMVERLSKAAQKYQGHALTAFLDRLVKDANWEKVVEEYKAQFEAEVTAPEQKHIYRIRSDFGIIWAAAALAMDYKILPWKKWRALNAIKKCFARALNALESSESEVCLPNHAESTSVLQKVREMLDTIKLLTIPRGKKASGDEKSERRKADGFVLDGIPHIRHARLEEWFPNKDDRRTMREAGIFRSTRKDTPTVERKISGVDGKPRYYAINIETLIFVTRESAAGSTNSPSVTGGCSATILIPCSVQILKSWRNS